VSDAAAERRRELKRRIYGYRVAQAIGAATELALPDHLGDAALAIDELAAACGADPGALERLLAALAEIGIVEPRDGGWALTPLGEPLRADTADSLRAETLHALADSTWRPWGRLADAVRSGTPAFALEFGSSAWEYRAAHPLARQRFDAMASERSRAENAAILAVLEPPATGLVVDVGGGEGELLAALLDRWPRLSGLLFEQPEVVAAARRRLERAGLAGRCRAEAGDFFRDVPAGGALYLLKAVLHNWSDADASRLLAVCRRALAPGARLVVVETLADRPALAGAELQDLHMLVVHGGRERTAAALERLLVGAGLRCVAIRPTGEGPCLIEAVGD
jgi:SAM-dependent methyltransferase